MRILTALAVCLVCLPAVVQGARIAQFSILEMRLDPAQDGLAALKGWRDVPGVAAVARDPERLRADGDRVEVLTKQRDALAEYLAVKPLSPVKWLALAEAEMSLGEVGSRTVQAYAMSQITGPYEGYVMGRRGVLGTLLWENLDADQRIGAARDLALATFAGPQELLVKGILGAKSKATRDAVRFEMLQIEGLGADRLASLGLQ